MTTRDETERRRIFLSLPMTAMINPESGLIEEAYRANVSQLINLLRHLGHDCFCSMEREEWGAKLFTPGDAYWDDREQLIDCDAVVAILGQPLSPGVLMELTIAAEHLKPALVYQLKNGPMPYLLPGLSKRIPLQIHLVDSFHEIVAILPEHLLATFS